MLNNVSRKLEGSRRRWSRAGGGSSAQESMAHGKILKPSTRRSFTCGLGNPEVPRRGPSAQSGPGRLQLQPLLPLLTPFTAIGSTGRNQSNINMNGFPTARRPGLLRLADKQLEVRPASHSPRRSLVGVESTGV